MVEIVVADILLGDKMLLECVTAAVWVGEEKTRVKTVTGKLAVEITTHKSWGGAITVHYETVGFLILHEQPLTLKCRDGRQGQFNANRADRAQGGEWAVSFEGTGPFEKRGEDQ